MSQHPDDSATDTFPSGTCVRVRGQVQGVGFRPNVWRLAHECRLTGQVLNDAEGVLIEAFGPPARLAEFVERLTSEAPPLARIDRIEQQGLKADAGRAHADFVIVPSQEGRPNTPVVPDASTCRQCIEDIFEPANRRFEYPFTNCTHCGPRFSIVRAIPYDRANTSMAAFDMCAACRREYEDPADRRFHAQPNACPECGPSIWLETRSGSRIESDALDAVRRSLAAGEIVAIKGIGGIHLACDATNADAIARLRARKRRPAKPLALMARDVEVITRYAVVDEPAHELLESVAAPIVLLPYDGPETLPEGLAPGQGTLGFMLPYSPLHALLMAPLTTPIVLTSGNASDEPQCISNADARDRLGAIADAFLLHDREIVNRVDDSVARPMAGAPRLLRRARGHAPDPLDLPAGFSGMPPVLALGGNLKNTFCLIRDGQAVLSQHLGDLENAAAHAAWLDTLRLYRELYRFEPEVLAVDAHPEYLPTKYGRDWAAGNDCTLVEVQHHHAHIAACLADHRIGADAPPVLGLAFDGLGFGPDGSLWGGEVLLADYCGYRRLCALVDVAMPGGAQAIRQPWRMSFAHLARCPDWAEWFERYGHLPVMHELAEEPLGTLQGMIDSGFNSPPTSSIGRLFDAVAALAGLSREVTFEGQAAMELEARVDESRLEREPGYPFDLERDEQGLLRLEPAPMWAAMLADLADGADATFVATRFHAGLAGATGRLVRELAGDMGREMPTTVALSGGVFQNRIFSERVVSILEAENFDVLMHRRVPCNDGGLSLGQAAVAAIQNTQGAWQ